MNRYTNRPIFLTAAAILAIALTACNRTAPDAAAPAAPAAAESSVAAAPAPETPGPLMVSSVKYGRYVEPKTFTVGGLGSKFKAADQVFAVVQLEGAANAATVQARLLDKDGQLISEQARDVRPDKPMKVNFQLTKELASPLLAGSYRVETLLNGEVVNTGDIIIE